MARGCQKPGTWRPRQTPGGQLLGVASHYYKGPHCTIFILIGTPNIVLVIISAPILGRRRPTSAAGVTLRNTFCTHEDHKQRGSSGGIEALARLAVDVVVVVAVVVGGEQQQQRAAAPGGSAGAAAEAAAAAGGFRSSSRIRDDIGYTQLLLADLRKSLFSWANQLLFLAPTVPLSLLTGSGAGSSIFATCGMVMNDQSAADVFGKGCPKHGHPLLGRMDA